MRLLLGIFPALGAQRSGPVFWASQILSLSGNGHLTLCGGAVNGSSRRTQELIFAPKPMVCYVIGPAIALDGDT